MPGAAMKDMDHSSMGQIAKDDVPGAICELEGLLTRQIDLVRQGQVREVETLAEQAGELVEHMSSSGMFKSAEFADRRDDFKRLYSNLCLGLGAERARTAEQLSQVRKGMKTVSTYRRNM